MKAIPSAALCALLAWLSACTSVPVGAIPDPLPETLEWVAAETTDGGAFLGIEVRENDSGSLESLSFDPGVRITAVADGSPAGRAGLRTGDVLLNWNGESVSDATALASLLRTAEPDGRVRLDVQRGDSAFEVAVALRPRGNGVRPAELLWRADPARSQAAWLSAADGVALVASDPEGPFPAAGIPVGSVVLEVEGVRQRSERGLILALLQRPPGDRVEVAYRRPEEAEVLTSEVRLHGPRRRVTRAGIPILFGYRSDPNGESSSFDLVDVWVLSLFSYRRDGVERSYSLLGLLNFSTGVGELEEVQ
ncbi:MAG: PDZ domain-containing protein [Planctomycetota bacterium]|jgi:hypothetical protein